MISNVSAALRKILNPIRKKKKDNEIKSTLMDTNVLDHEGSQGHFEQPKKEDPQTLNEDTIPDHYAPSFKVDTPLASEESLQQFKKESGLTFLILKMRNKIHSNRAEVVTHHYKSGAREQKSNAKLPKGAMVDKKVA